MNIVTPPLPNRRINQLHESISAETGNTGRSSSSSSFTTVPLHQDKRFGSIDYLNKEILASRRAPDLSHSSVTTVMRRSCMRSGSYSRDTAATSLNSAAPLNSTPLEAIQSNSSASMEKLLMEEERIVFEGFSTGDALPINKWDDSRSKSDSSIGNAASRLTPPVRFMMGTSEHSAKTATSFGAKSHTPSVTWKACIDTSSSHRTLHSDNKVDSDDSDDDENNHDLDEDDDDDDDSQVSILVDDDVSACIDNDASNSDTNESESDGDTDMDLFDKLYAKYNSSAILESDEIDVDDDEDDEENEGDEAVAMKQASESSKSISMGKIDDEETLKERLLEKMKAKLQKESNPVYTEDESQYDYGATNDIEDDIAFTMYSFGNVDKFTPLPPERMARKQRSFCRRDGQGHNSLLKSAVMAAMESNDDDDEFNGDPNNPFAFRNRRNSCNSTNSGTVSIQSMQDTLRNSCGDYSSRKRARRTARTNSNRVPTTTPEDAAAIQNASHLMESLCVGFKSAGSNHATTVSFPSSTVSSSHSEQHDTITGSLMYLANGSSFNENNSRKHESFFRSPPIRRVSRKKSYDAGISDDFDSEGNFTDEDDF